MHLVLNHCIFAAVLIQQICPGLHVEDYRSPHAGVIRAWARQMPQSPQRAVPGGAPSPLHPGVYPAASAGFAPCSAQAVHHGGPVPPHLGAFPAPMPPGPSPMMHPFGPSEVLFPQQVPVTSAPSPSHCVHPAEMPGWGCAHGSTRIGVPEPLHPPSWKRMSVPEPQNPPGGQSDGSTCKATTPRPGPTQCPATSTPGPAKASSASGLAAEGHMPTPSKSPNLCPEENPAVPWFSIIYVYS